jgi:hypothetical protein
MNNRRRSGEIDSKSKEKTKRIITPIKKPRSITKSHNLMSTNDTSVYENPWGKSTH